MATSVVASAQNYFKLPLSKEHCAFDDENQALWKTCWAIWAHRDRLVQNTCERAKR
jgi:hypothetical protein